MRRAARLVGLGVALLFAVIFVATLALRTPLGGRLIGRALERGVSSLVAGSLHVEEVSFRGFDEIVARGVILRDPEGREVTRADSASLSLEPLKLVSMELSMPEVTLRGGTVSLYEGTDGLPSLLDAIASADASGDDDEPSPLSARIPRIRVSGFEIRGSVSGVDDLAFEDVALEAGLTYVDDVLTLTVDDVAATLTSPVERALTVRGRDIVYDSRPEVGARLSVTLGEGEERATVDLTTALPSPRAPEEHLSLRATIHRVRPSSLGALGVPGVDALEGAASGEITLRGPQSALVLDGELRHDAGTLTLEGEIGERVVLRASSERFDARKLVSDAPDVSPAAFDATLTLEEGRPPRAEIALSPLSIEGVKLPATRSVVSLGDRRIDVRARATSLATGTLSVEGSVGRDGTLALRAKGRLPSMQDTPELRALLGGVRGGASVDARITGDVDSPRLRGGIVFSPFAYGPARAARLELSGALSELAAAPSLSVDLVARDVALFEREIGDVALTIEGRRGALAARGRLGRDGGGTIAARFDLGEVFHLHRGEVVASTFSLDARGVRVSEHETRIESVHARLGPGRAVVSGVVRARGPDALQLDLADVKLSDVREFVDLPFAALEGDLSLHAELEGDLEGDPRIFAQGALGDVQGGGLRDAFAGFFYQHQEGHSLGQVQVDLGERGSGALGVGVYVDLGASNLEAALEDAYFDVSMDVFGFDLSLTQTLLPEELGEIAGRADGSVHLAGLLDAIEADARIETQDLRIAGLPPLAYVLNVQRKYGSLTVDLSASDDEGLLGEVSASTVGNALAMLDGSHGFAESLALAPWQLRARIPEREIGDLPAVVVRELPAWTHPSVLALSLKAQGGSLEPRVDATGVLTLPPHSGSVCGAAREVSLPFELVARDGEATLEGSLLFAAHAAATVEAHAAPPLEAWLDTGTFEPVPVSARASFEQLRLGNLPVACELATGDLSGEVRVADLMGDAPRATAYAQSNSIRLKRSAEAAHGAHAHHSPPLSVGATVEIDDERTRLDVTVRSSLDDSLRANGALPFSLVPGGLAALDESGRVSVFVDIERAPLSLFLGLTPAFANVRGVADGWGLVGGTFAEPVHHAELSISEGRFTLTSLGQRVSEVEGIASLDPGRLTLRHFRARDGDGHVTARGEVTIEDLAPTGAALDVELRRFPVRDEGIVVAAISGRARLDAELTSELADAELVLRDLDVSMPTLGAPSVQDLADHPDVRIVRGLDDEEEDDGALPFAVRLHVDATEPFEVKGPDFNASLTADLRIAIADDSLRIGGAVELRGGRFAVLGKPFEVNSGTLRFDPQDETLSPAVSLEAVHLVNGDRNRRVVVSVGGTLSEPTVRFSSNVPTQNEGEIISLIVTGETHSETERGFDSAAAGRDAADFVAGVAFGVVSLSLREEFGGFLPVVTLEGQNRFRARFDAERFLPERVRRVVRRARIEGYFTAGQSGEEDQVRQTGQGRGSGFSIELGFPRGIVGRGTVAPPNNWSTQVLWEP